MDLRAQMDRIYRDLAPHEIPWNVESPPALLVELVESGRIVPCDVVELGCGAGHASAWLADRGFRVTGIDLSPEAIALAQRTYGSRCRWIAADVLLDPPELAGAFDFVFEWEVLHHVLPEDRPRWIANVHRMLRPRGRYLSVCFSEEDAPSFGEGGKLRHTKIGTTLYFSSESELRSLFEPLFAIDDLRTIDVPARERNHRAVMTLMRS